MATGSWASLRKEDDDLEKKELDSMTPKATKSLYLAAKPYVGRDTEMSGG
jgi:hypothetical protein